MIFRLGWPQEYLPLIENETWLILIEKNNKRCLGEGYWILKPSTPDIFREWSRSATSWRNTVGAFLIGALEKSSGY